MKSGAFFILMLVVFAGGLYVVGLSEGTTTWVEVAVVTAAFGIWQIWKRLHRPKRQGDGGKPRAA